MKYVGSTWVEFVVLFATLTLLRRFFGIFKFEFYVTDTDDGCVHVDRGRSWLAHARGGYFLEWYPFLWR